MYNQLLPALSPKLQRSVLLSSEKGSSSWLTTLPLSDHGYALHKGAFHDDVCLRYGWQPSQIVFVANLCMLSTVPLVAFQ